MPTAFNLTAPGSAGTTIASWLNNNVQTPLLSIGVIMVVICLIWAGIRIASKASSGEGFRQALSSVGMVLFGGLVVGGAAILGGVLLGIGKQLSGNEPTIAATTLSSWVYNNVQLSLYAIAAVALSIFLMIAGMIIMFESNSGDGLRSAISSLGVLVFAGILIGGAGVIAGLFVSFGSNLGA